MNIFERFGTLAEAVDMVDDNLDVADVVILPPDNDLYASDEEVGDDDIGIAGNLDLPGDVSGAVEIHATEFDNPSSDEEDEESERLVIMVLLFCTSIFSHSENITFDI